jgi:hypothetical protein
MITLRGLLVDCRPVRKVTPVTKVKKERKRERAVRENG